MRTHVQLNVSTGKRTVIPFTAEEDAAADKAGAEEKVKHDAQRLVDMKADALKAELEAMVNVDTGTTDEAKAYKAEQTKQGK